MDAIDSSVDDVTNSQEISFTSRTESDEAFAINEVTDPDLQEESVDQETVSYLLFSLFVVNNCYHGILHFKCLK